MHKHKTKLIWGGVIVVAVALMIFGGRTSDAGNWPGTAVACLPGGHANALTHIHADLSVFIDGEGESIPGNTGVSAACMAEVHTHAADGEIHIETPSRNHDRTLADFFAVWGEDLEKEAYEREITVNGVAADPGYVFADGDQITVRFTSVTNTATTTEAATTSPQE